MNAILLLPGDDGASTSVVVLDEDGQRALRRLSLALELGGPPRRARSPPGPSSAAGGELKVELAGELLCLEYREP